MRENDLQGTERKGLSILGKMGLGLFLLVACPISIMFYVAIQNDRKSSSTPVIAPIGQTAPTPQYDPQKILEDAKREFANSDYAATLDTLQQLNPSDLKQRQAALLYARANESATKVARFQARTARLKYAEDYERGLLDQGMDATVRSEGTNADSLTITYVLMGRPAVYKLINDSELMSQWKALGFKKVRFSDGYDASWTYRVE